MPSSHTKSWFPASFHSPLFSSPSAFLPSSNKNFVNEREQREAGQSGGWQPSADTPRDDVRRVSSQSQRNGRISVTTPDLLPTNQEQETKDPLRNRQAHQEETKFDGRPPIVPTRFHPELFSATSAFVPSNNPDRSVVIGCKPITQANFFECNLLPLCTAFLITICSQNWSTDMLEKCSQRRLDIMLKDPKAEADQCQLKCFNEKDIKGILAESRASVASFNAEMRSEVTSLSATKV